MKNLCVIILLMISLGCSETEGPLKQNETIPTPMEVATRPLLDTDLTYYSYFPVAGAPDDAKIEAETRLLDMIDAGLSISHAWVGTSSDCENNEPNCARLVVRLSEADSDIDDFSFTGDPAPPSHPFPWVFWYERAHKQSWRYDFESESAVELPEPSHVPREYPVPDSPATYYRPWYVFGATEEEWRVGVEAFITELITEGIALEQVTVPNGHSDSCSQSEACNTSVVMIRTVAPEPKLTQLGIMAQSSNCMNLCQVTLLKYQFE